MREDSAEAKAQRRHAEQQRAAPHLPARGAAQTRLHPLSPGAAPHQSAGAAPWPSSTRTRALRTYGSATAECAKWDRYAERNFGQVRDLKLFCLFQSSLIEKDLVSDDVTDLMYCQQFPQLRTDLNSDTKKFLTDPKLLLRVCIVSMVIILQLLLRAILHLDFKIRFQLWVIKPIKKIGSRVRNEEKTSKIRLLCIRRTFSTELSSYYFLMRTIFKYTVIVY